MRLLSAARRVWVVEEESVTEAGLLPQTQSAVPPQVWRREAVAGDCAPQEERLPRSQVLKEPMSLAHPPVPETVAAARSLHDGVCCVGSLPSQGVVDSARGSLFLLWGSPDLAEGTTSQIHRRPPKRRRPPRPFWRMTILLQMILTNKVSSRTFIVESQRG